MAIDIGKNLELIDFQYRWPLGRETIERLMAIDIGKNLELIDSSIVSLPNGHRYCIESRLDRQLNGFSA